MTQYKIGRIGITFATRKTKLVLKLLNLFSMIKSHNSYMNQSNFFDYVFYNI
jgi:hypothetical protein